MCALSVSSCCAGGMALPLLAASGMNRAADGDEERVRRVEPDSGRLGPLGGGTDCAATTEVELAADGPRPPRRDSSTRGSRDWPV